MLKKSLTNFEWFWIHWTDPIHTSPTIYANCQILYCHNLFLILPNFGETLFELYKKHAEIYDSTIHMYYLPSYLLITFSSINSRYLAHQNESSHEKKSKIKIPTKWILCDLASMHVAFKYNDCKNGRVVWKKKEQFWSIYQSFTTNAFMEVHRSNEKEPMRFGQKL